MTTTWSSRSAPGPPPADRGSATVLLLAAMTVVATVAATALGLATASAYRQRAATAADLAALAAATAAAETATAWPVSPGADGGPCQRGGQVALVNGGRLVDCQVLDGAAEVGTREVGAREVGAREVGAREVVVTVAVDLPGLLAPLGPVSVRARAGP